MRSSKHLLAATILFAALDFLPVRAEVPLRILAIGDSITQGGRRDRVEHTYRLPLQRMLAGLGVSFDFVGSRDAGLHPVQWPPPFDPDHEGYYGGRTRAVVRLVADSLKQFAPPDVALVHLGSNDLQSWDYSEAVVEPLEQLIAALRTRNPRILVLVAEPAMPGLRSPWRRWLLIRLVDRTNSRESPVIFVPMPASWDVRRDTFDGVHPNASGQLKLAAQWIEALAPHLTR